VRTSDATTAKPLPCSPARAAFHAALMSQYIGLESYAINYAMMSAILRADSLIEDMVATTFWIILPPSIATVDASDARLLPDSHFLS